MLNFHFVSFLWSFRVGGSVNVKRKQMLKQFFYAVSLLTPPWGKINSSKLNPSHLFVVSNANEIFIENDYKQEAQGS